MEFRFRALNELRDPSGLDKPVRFANGRVWVALLASAIVVMGVVVWAFQADIPREVSASGHLAYPSGLRTVPSPTAGVVSAVDAEVGQSVADGDPVFSVTDRAGETTVVEAPVAGTVLRQPPGVGSSVASGQVLSVVEIQDQPLEAMLLVDSSNAALIAPGTRVRVEAEGIPSGAFGQIQGTVTEVSRYPITEEEYGRYVDEAGDTRTLFADGPRYLVRVRLEPAKNASGVRWTSSDGPPFPLPSQFEVSATIFQGNTAPIDLIFHRG